MSQIVTRRFTTPARPAPILPEPLVDLLARPPGPASTDAASPHPATVADRTLAPAEALIEPAGRRPAPPLRPRRRPLRVPLRRVACLRLPVTPARARWSARLLRLGAGLAAALLALGLTTALQQTAALHHDVADLHRRLASLEAAAPAVNAAGTAYTVELPEATLHITVLPPASSGQAVDDAR